MEKYFENFDFSDFWKDYTWSLEEYKNKPYRFFVPRRRNNNNNAVNALTDNEIRRLFFSIDMYALTGKA